MSSNPWQLGYPQNKNLSLKFIFFLKPQNLNLVTVQKQVLSDQLRLFSPTNLGKPSLSSENKKSEKEKERKERKKKVPLG